MLVVGNELRSLERFERFLPLGDLGVELGKVGVAVAREVGLVLRRDRHQRVVDVLNGGLRQHRDRACSADCRRDARRPAEWSVDLGTSTGTMPCEQST